MTPPIPCVILIRVLKGLIFSFGCLATALSVIFLDQETSLWFAQESHQAWRNAAREVTDIALGGYWFGLAILTYLLTKFVLPRFARFSLHERAVTNMRRWSVHMFFALLGSGLLLRVLKWAFGRQRPHRSETFDPLVFQPFTHDWYFHSMPSGHTQVLFASAASFALLWPRGAGLFYLLAAVLSFTRVMTHQHFVSDVIAGALVGVYGTYWVRSALVKKVPLPEPLIGPVRPPKSR